MEVETMKSEVGMNWKTARLGDVATFVNGYAFKPSDWAETGLEIIRIQNLTKGSSETNFFKGSIPEKYKVVNGDILISWSATLDIFVWNGKDAWLNQHIFKVVFDKIEIDRNYFIYAIKNILDDMRKQVHGATMQHITKGKFDNLQIPLPPLATQKRIAEILDAADALRRKDQELLKKYDELAQAIFIDMFGDPVKNEKGWEVKKFKDLGTLDRGVSKHRPRNAPELLGGIYPLIQTGDVANSGGVITKYKATYSELGLRQSKLWPNGTLCITIAANIAKTGILSFDACFPDSIVGFKPNRNISNSVFIQYWIGFLQKILEDNAPESAQKNINLEILRGLDVICPPIELQDDFENKIDLLKSIMEKSSNSNDGVLFESLIQKAFKGELVS
jgi:type I restriction enzyme S subunit